jgi:hypothetical protein
MKARLSEGTPVAVASWAPGGSPSEWLIDATHAYFSDGFGVTRVSLAGFSSQAGVCQ